MVNTAKVSGRRNVRYGSIDDALADAQRMADLVRADKARFLGNWSLGQIFGHLATWADYSYTGAPLKVPFIVRLMMRPMKGRFLYKAMPAGSKIPKVPGGTLATDPVPLDQGLEHFRTSFAKLKAEAPAQPHLVFGRLSHEEWINSHLRHAELHMSFVTDGSAVQVPSA